VRLAVGLLLLAILPDSRDAGAQPADETIEKVRVCSVMGEPERRQCLEKIFRDNPLPPSAAPAHTPAGTRAADNWIVSETTSPVDYSPVVVATASYSARPAGPALRLSIECRAGRTDLVIGGATLTRRSDDYSVSYSVSGGKPMPVAVTAAEPGRGLAVKADVVSLLAALPDQGDLIVRVDGPEATALEGRFVLPAMKNVLERLVTPCRWRLPPAARRPETLNSPTRRAP